MSTLYPREFHILLRRISQSPNNQEIEEYISELQISVADVLDDIRKETPQCILLEAMIDIIITGLSDIELKKRLSDS